MDGIVERATDVVEIGALWVSPSQVCEARVHGRPIRLSDARRRLLAALLSAGGRVVTRQELYKVARDADLPGRSRAIDVHIAGIRKALGPLGRTIVSVRGIGYRVDVLELR